MKKIYVIICVFLTMIISGCDKKIEIDLSDYRPLENYSFEEHDFIMRKGQEEIDQIGGIYTLKGLSSKDYVGHVQYYLIPGAPTKTLYCHKNADEPIISMNPHKIQISYNEKTSIFEDAYTIERLVAVVRKGGETAGSYPDVYADARIRMRFLFDTPSNLEWHCHMIVEGKNIKMLWYDSKREKSCISDVTDILEEHPKVEDIYSLAT